MRNIQPAHLILIVIISFSFISFCPNDSSISYRPLLDVPQEKLYLHLDKPYYSAGEPIWFKGYLVNASEHTSSIYTNFIYVELINNIDSVICRKKIRRSETGFNGKLSIPATIKPGDYCVRGYSEWMRGCGPDFFFYKYIKIGNNIANQIQSSATFTTEDNNKFTVRIQFKDEKGQPIKKSRIAVSYENKHKIFQQKIYNIDNSGELTVRFTTDKNIEKEKQFINAVFLDRTYDYHNSFPIPDLKNEFDIRFYPEGGELLSEELQIIAFKAEKKNGQSIDLKGTIISETGDTLNTFETEHAGMGKVVISPKAGSSFKAIVTTSDGLTKEVRLPEVNNNGINLQVIKRNNDTYVYKIIKGAGVSSLPPLLLVAHTRGMVDFIQPLEWETGYIKAKDLREGVTQLLLTDTLGNPLSERLIFIRPDSPYQWENHCTTPKFGNRDSVNLNIKINSKTPLKGNFSVSITDNSTVTTDSMADNICTNLLLSSDLKGRIENPGYYFYANPRLADYHADLLMLTQGWRRFNTKELLQGKQPEYRHYFEQGQIITGHISSVFGKDIEQATVDGFSGNSFAMKSCTTDSKGKFCIEGFSFPDSTLLAVSAISKKGNKRLVVEIDRDSFPPIFLPPFSISEKQYPLLDDYNQLSKQKYYIDGGERVYFLKEVEVTADKKIRNSRGIAPSIEAYIVNDETLRLNQNRTAYDIVTSCAGVYSFNGKLSIRQSPQEPLIIIDGVSFPDDSNILKDIQGYEIEYLYIEKGPAAALYGSFTSGGAIILETKRGKINVQRDAPLGSSAIMPLGYSKPEEFYHPLYRTEEEKKNPQPDLRTTLYWNPYLIVDEAGNANVHFYSNDTEGNYTYTIEGITEEGTPLFYRGIINRK